MSQDGTDETIVATSTLEAIRKLAELAGLPLPPKEVIKTVIQTVVVGSNVDPRACWLDHTYMCPFGLPDGQYKNRPDGRCNSGSCGYFAEITYAHEFPDEATAAEDAIIAERKRIGMVQEDILGFLEKKVSSLDNELAQQAVRVFLRALEDMGDKKVFEGFVVLQEDDLDPD